MGGMWEFCERWSGRWRRAVVKVCEDHLGRAEPERGVEEGASKQPSWVLGVVFGELVRILSGLGVLLQKMAKFERLRITRLTT